LPTKVEIRITVRPWPLHRSRCRSTVVFSWQILTGPLSRVLRSGCSGAAACALPGLVVSTTMTAAHTPGIHPD
jgi:hypothetical protein